MDNNFNLKESLNGIKANLFDIYENQEQIIGSEEDADKRNLRLNNFIEVKDMALMLIEAIESLYTGTDYSIRELKNPELPTTTEESQILNLVEMDENDSIKEEENYQDNSSEVEETNKEDVFEEDSTEDNDELNQDKYYLNCDFSKVNFAYVPESIYEKIKNHNSFADEEFEEDEESEAEDINVETENTDDLYYHKEDSDKPRGIIVRNDQYMKLALSKHRQESVIKEAKQFRVEEVKKKRVETQKKELEKAKLNFDI